jgi:hypothetical protein
MGNLVMTAFAYKRRTALDIRLRLLDLAIGADTHERVLDTIGVGIRKANERADKASDEDGIVDDECEFVENLLGAAYVVCQAQITAVVQAALKVPDHGLGQAHDVRALGPRFNADHSQIEVLWALANYFKHRDEWPTDWKNMNGLSKRTATVIEAAGLCCGSSGNLRTGAEALGNSDYNNVTAFYGAISQWSTAVRDRLRSKFGQ